MSGSWDGPPSGSNVNVNYGSAGNAQLPQFELRFDLETWSTYVVGHLDEKNLSG